MKRSKRRSLGQHNLIDTQILNRIVEVAKINKNERVCEVGAGNGILTRELCKHSKSVISYEVDHKLVEKLKKTLSTTFSNLSLINCDFLKEKRDIKFDVFVSNIPYSKSKEILEWLSLQKFNRAILMVQKEFADKLLANPGETNYRTITVVSQYRFYIERLFNVKKESFDPEPSIESEIIRLYSKPDSITERIITNINCLFSYRNKQTRSISSKFGFDLDHCSGNNSRIDQLNPLQLVNLANLLPLRKNGIDSLPSLKR